MCCRSYIYSIRLQKISYEEISLVVLYIFHQIIDSMLLRFKPCWVTCLISIPLDHKKSQKEISLIVLYIFYQIIDIMLVRIKPCWVTVLYLFHQIKENIFIRKEISLVFGLPHMYSKITHEEIRLVGLPILYPCHYIIENKL